jgi:hypothetical protein
MFQMACNVTNTAAMQNIWIPKLLFRFKSSSLIFSLDLIVLYTVIKKSQWPDDYSTKTRKNIIWRWPSQNTFGMWTVLYWTRYSRTQFGVSINVWRLAGDTLNITCNFLYCNHRVLTLCTETFWSPCIIPCNYIVHIIYFLCRQTAREVYFTIILHY